MKRLELIFENEIGKNVTISLDNPKENLDANTVISAMDEIIAQNVFTSNGGDLVHKKGARVVERNVTEIEIDVA